MTQTHRTRICADCGLEFVVAVGDARGEPRRCPDCRRDGKPDARRTPLPRSRRGIGGIGTRRLYHAECAACGRETRLPFKPAGDRPPYCPECFAHRRGEGPPGRHPPSAPS